MQTCRLCGGTALHVVVDLGTSPLSNAYLSFDDLAQPETFYPLAPRFCEDCYLVQLPELVAPERIFSEYAYFSSYSDSWTQHAQQYAGAMIETLGLGRGDLVVEVASNDGYLLKNFHAAGIPVLGIEPARNVAAVAEQAGVRTISRFFGVGLAEELARNGQRANLLIGNNVLAHVPDLHDFVGGLSAILAPGGVLTMEFPHLLRLLEQTQFDTIYHEHFSYLSLLTVARLFGQHGLTIFDVEELPTHGGSLRIYAAGQADRPRGARVDRLEQREREAGLTSLEPYRAFATRVQQTKLALLRFLVEQRERGLRVAGYGAPAKANTLLNYCGVRSDLLEYTVDRSPHKQGRFLPGTRIPVHAPERLAVTRPDWIVILPWNLRQEIADWLRPAREWGARLVVPIPVVEVIDADR
jgi:SAM-dependent methyltransferase